MTDFGTSGYITLEPDTANEEAATFTGVTANANGTYSLTGVKTTLAKSPYTETAGLVRSHSGGTKVVVTDNVGFWNTFANKNNDETIAGTWTFTNFPVTASNPNASDSVKGITKLSVAAAVLANPIAVGDNDVRVPTANPTTLFAPLVSTAFGGTGADGALAISSGTTTIDCAGARTVIKNYSSISITSTGQLSFSNPHANGTLVILKSRGNVTITSSTSPAIDGRTLGAAGGAGSGSGIGAVGIAGTAMFGTNPGFGNGGVNSGAGGAGGALGSVISPVLNTTFGILPKFVPIVTGAGGGGGGYGSNTSVGGNGGRGGGVLIINCGGALNITSTLSCAGTDGSAANEGGTPNQSAGGGGGGGGGSLNVFYNTLTANSGTFNVSGGAGGLGGTFGASGTGGGGGGGGGSNTVGIVGQNGTGAGDGGNGGAGGTGLSIVALNTEFA